jgi:hypothetical protein
VICGWSCGFLTRVATVRVYFVVVVVALHLREHEACGDSQRDIHLLLFLLSRSFIVLHLSQGSVSAHLDSSRRDDVGSVAKRECRAGSDHCVKLQHHSSKV